MSTVNLGLVKPILGDEIHQTIQDLSNNFQKIDDVAEVYVASTPNSGIWQQNKKVYKSNPSIGDYIGWVNVRSGTAAPRWINLTAHAVGNLVVPTIDNGHYYECIQSGRSAINEPTFPTTSGLTVRDIQGSTIWSPSKNYSINDVVLPSTDNNRFYVCTVAGISGTTEPIWSLVDGGTVNDNMAVWTGYRIVTWQEKGVAALFRPFGKIE